ncbi:MAG: restriction endonuclease subunit S [Proteobacteria bacterium]|nr:restriction endonuclease subunit S [Pseudomonadota bacterium]
MEVAGFKRTELGFIPEDWDVKSLGDIGDPIIGLTYSPRDVRSDGVLVLRSSNIQKSRLCFDDNVYVETSIPEKLFVKQNDILICVRNGSRDLIGKSIILNKPAHNVTFGAFMSVFRSDENPYVSWLFQSNIINKQINEYLGATINQITNKNLRSFKIPLPPTKSEKQAIAEALSDMDATIEALEQLIAKKRSIKQGTMQELLTGKRRLPGFSGEWVKKKLGEITHIKTGSRNNQDKVEDGTYPFFVRSADVERINSYSHDCEAILVPGEGNIGNIFHYIHGKFDVHQRVYVITQFVKDTWGKYVYLYMAQNFGAHAMQNSVKATVDSLRLPTFQNFVIKMPVDIDEQKAVAACLTDMIEELNTLETKLTKARYLKQGMMQQLLTGRIRLI